MQCQSPVHIYNEKGDIILKVEIECLFSITNNKYGSKHAITYKIFFLTDGSNS